MTSFSDLSLDLIWEIFARVPLTSLSVVRSTCKNWNDLTKEQILGQKVAAKSQFLELTMINSTVSSFRFDFQEIQNKDDQDLFDHLSMKQITRQTRWIQPRNELRNWDGYALGYDKNNRNHKILRLFNDYYNKKNILIDVYDFSTDSWRDEKLAVSYYKSEDPWIVEILISIKVEPNAVSWSSFLTLDLGLINAVPDNFLTTSFKPMCFFIDEETKVVVLFYKVGYDREAGTFPYRMAYIAGGDGYFKSVNTGLALNPSVAHGKLVCSSYVPSLDCLVQV
ncbi:unnamed protein product [Microthlaspi erraticum]|uniref:F-box domain-containing protein n=1 Tax=Microthlaspi erraticum TaxID=1685480 RepID=A0A6D2HLQ7_9BRAS|nr:unnamed protein product [Microthlaspi erraticum]